MGSNTLNKDPVMSHKETKLAKSHPCCFSSNIFQSILALTIKTLQTILSNNQASMYNCNLKNDKILQYKTLDKAQHIQEHTHTHTNTLYLWEFRCIIRKGTAEAHVTVSGLN